MQAEIQRFIQDCHAHESKVSLVDTRYCIANFGEQYRVELLTTLHALGANVYAFEGASLDESRLLNALLSEVESGAQIQPDKREQSAKEGQLSVYKQLAKGLRDKKTGVVFIDSAHLLDAQIAKLIDKLVSHSKKHSLDWCFVLIANQSVFKKVHPRRFLHANRVAIQIEDVEDSRRSNNLVSILGATLCAGVIALAFYYILSSLEQGTNETTTATSLIDLESKEDQFGEFDLEQLLVARDNDFETRLQEWESFSKPRLDSRAQRSNKPTIRASSERKPRMNANCCSASASVETSAERS